MLSHLAPERPQLDGLVLGAGDEGVLVVEHLDGLDAVGVAIERLQLRGGDDMVGVWRGGYLLMRGAITFTKVVLYGIVVRKWF